MKYENKKDVKYTNDGFEIFGYSVDDILDKIGDNYIPRGNYIYF